LVPRSRSACACSRSISRSSRPKAFSTRTPVAARCSRWSPFSCSPRSHSTTGSPDVESSREQLGGLASTVEDGGARVRVLKAFGREDREIERLHAQADRLRGTNLDVVRRRSVWVPLLALIPNLMLAATLGIGGYRVLPPPARPRALVAAYQFLGLLAFPLRNIG